MIADVWRLLADAREALDEAGAVYAVLGGCARNAYAEPRATKDVDFVVEADAERFAAVARALEARGFSAASAVGEPGEAVPDLVLYRDASGRRVDLLFAKTDFERSALLRRELGSPFEGLTLPIVSPEDLVVYKLVSARPQDWADLDKVVRAQAIAGRTLDWAYVEAWCDAWDVRERLERLRAGLGAQQT